MNEFHRVMMHTVSVGDKDIVLRLEEDYAPENMDQPVAVRVIGPNGLQSSSVEGMLKLLQVAPQYLLSDPVEMNSASSAAKALDAASGADGSPKAPSGIIEDAFDSLAGPTALDHTLSDGPPHVYAQQRTRRFVRVGESDVEITECVYLPQKEEMGRRWFEGPNGIKAATYGEMCSKLGGRPKPRLPEDEHRPGLAGGGNASPADASSSIPEQGTPEVAGNAFDPVHATGNKKPSAGSRNWEPFDPTRPRTPYWGQDNRELEDISLDELQMRVVWEAESIKESDPDLYEAALDSVKRQQYLDQQEMEEKLAADLAPRCQYIKAGGEPCGSPALKKRRYCYFHIRTSEERKKTKEVQLPVLEDDLAIQMAVTNVCRGLLKGNLESKCASTLLYGLQVASVAVRKVAAAKARIKE